MYKYAYLFNPDTGTYDPDAQMFQETYNPGTDVIIGHHGVTAYLAVCWCDLAKAYGEYMKAVKHEQHQ